MSNHQSITIATAGHVDHGKTSLVRLITGTDTDTLAEEKARGLSINLGFAYHHVKAPDGGELTLGFVDVPGHTDFINNALAGIGAADYAMLIVAADDGVMPQTREHLSIIDLLGIERGVIVITKTDRVGADRAQQVADQVRELVAGTLLADSPVFGVSSHTGAGARELVAHLEAMLVDAASRPPDSSRRARMAIDRVFSARGLGTIVTGTVMAGVITPGTELFHSGSGAAIRIKGMHRDRAAIERAVAGERAALNINLAPQELERGDWLLENPIRLPVRRMDVRLRLVAGAGLKPTAQYHLYHGSSHHLVYLRPLHPDCQEFFQVTSHEPLFALHGDRFILRDPSCTSTLGGGRVIDIFVPRRGRSSVERQQVLGLLEGDDLAALRGLLDTSAEGVDLEQFCAGRNCNDVHAGRLPDSLARVGHGFASLNLRAQAKPLLLAQKFVDEYTKVILETVADFHRRQGNQLGISEPELSRLTKFPHSHLLFRGILELLVGAGRLKRSGTLLHLPDHKARLSAEERAFMDGVRPVLLKAGFLPPRTRELVEMTGMDLRRLERTLAQARRAGSLVQVADNRHYLPETIAAIAEVTEQLAAANDGRFTVIEFRDRIGIGRNLCIEILEYFDRVGFSVRDGNSRFLRTTRDKLFGDAG